MSYFLSHFEAGAFGAWLSTTIKGLWRSHISRRAAKPAPPRPLTIQERMAALRPEIGKERETA